MKKILCVFGTRPEAIKMAPVVLALRARRRAFKTLVAVTAQHREMLDQVLSLFRISADFDLDIMREGQTLTDVSVLGLRRLEPVLQKAKPDMVLVHGDTTTTLIATLAAYYQKIPVGHVEAGLRSFDALNPYPEEINRRLADAVCALHFAPTAAARENLLRENVSPKGIFVTGNTGLDALRLALANIRAGRFRSPRGRFRRFEREKFVLVTAHRRENFGKPLADFCRAVADVARRRPEVHFVYPVHPNPHVLGPVRKFLSGPRNVHLLPPLDYPEFVLFLQAAHLVLTDSGGLQEEAPSLGKPVLVLRKVTERPEAVQAGTVKIIGTDTAVVRRWVLRLLEDRAVYRRMANAVNPYGDGRAAGRIIEAISYYFQLSRTPPRPFH
ncbi:MAG TPA: UDP-N-acetylglucosamine 2-epimerase (non-hydrolyzing) [Elusimicrobiota bacterium]|nr:UDP-N-acetylglucosamine 2-epimerase (non-hydrolyzing) [Elusimicrobiota bacterium]